MYNSKDNHATPGQHINLTPGTVIADNYIVIRQAGTGNFARVFECKNLQTNAKVAVKIMKRGYERDADFESNILKAINKNDTGNKQNVVKMVERRTWNGFAVIVFNLKGASLRNWSIPLPLKDIAKIARDIGSALNFLHFTVRAVHTDLKPENILSEVTPVAGAPFWSICDFGSASFYTDRLDTDLITTRPYRAPEVVLNKGWNYPADIWSLGCILYELFTGRKLFDVHNDVDHLSFMTQKLGKITISSYPVHPRSTRPMLPLTEELRNEDKDFVDLLTQMLRYEPDRRIKARDIGSHPFVNKQFSSSTAASASASAAASKTYKEDSVAAKMTKELDAMDLRPPAPISKITNSNLYNPYNSRPLSTISNASINVRNIGSVKPNLPTPSSSGLYYDSINYKANRRIQL